MTPQLPKPFVMAVEGTRYIPTLHQPNRPLWWACLASYCMMSQRNSTQIIDIAVSGPGLRYGSE